MAHSKISLDLRDTIRDRIIRGRLKPGVRLNEVHLARELEVSRTPLREALFGLVNEGFVEEIPRRGFFVAGLSVEEIRQLYCIRQILDPAALRMAGLPDERTIDRLKAVNAKIAAAKRPMQVIELDDEWHLLLIEGCGNQILLDMIRQHMARTRRYEFAYLSQASNVGVATDEHDAIIQALSERKLARACKLLQQNMSSAEGPLIDWVVDQQSSEEVS